MSFHPPPFTRERLSILLRALDRQGGKMKARDLNRHKAGLLSDDGLESVLTPLSPPCIPPKFVLHGLSSKSKFLAIILIEFA